MFKCPYCQNTTNKKTGNVYGSWKSVRSHVPSCKLNTKTYMFCEYYGPILISELEKFQTIQHFKEFYPKSSFSGYHWRDLRRKNQSSLSKGWDRDKIIKAIQSFVEIHEEIPITRDFANSKSYPAATTVENRFGTWNKAIEAAGFASNGQSSYGIPSMAKDGFMYRSKAEAYFVDHFLLGKYKYEYELPYGNGWFYDFYLPEFDLYIEITSDIRPQRTIEKKEFNKKHNRNCVYITKDEIRGQYFKFAPERARSI